MSENAKGGDRVLTVVQKDGDRSVAERLAAESYSSVVWRTFNTASNYRGPILTY